MTMRATVAGVGGYIYADHFPSIGLCTFICIAVKMKHYHAKPSARCQAVASCKLLQG